jgi:hypothetical protein
MGEQMGGWILRIPPSTDGDLADPLSSLCSSVASSCRAENPARHRPGELIAAIEAADIPYRWNDESVHVDRQFEAAVDALISHL